MPAKYSSLVIVELRILLAESLKLLFKERQKFTSIMAVRHADEAIQRISPRRRHVFLLSGLSCISLKRAAVKIASRFPESRIVYLDERPRPTGGIVASMTGSHGYWTLCDSPQQLLCGVEQVAIGGCSISPTAENLLKAVGETVEFHGDPPAFGLHLLTDREVECFENLVRFRTLEECAQLMGVCCKTVENFKYRIMKKLGARSWADLVHLAYYHDLAD